MLEFILPEPALADSVKITFARTAGKPDGAADRVLQFSGEVETCATHQVAIGGAGISAAADLSAVTSVTPTTDLVDGAVYTVTLEYQDCGGHAKSTTADRTIDYAGTSTLAPTLTQPGSVSSIAEDFVVEFTLPEAACSTSLPYLTFISSGRSRAGLVLGDSHRQAQQYGGGARHAHVSDDMVPRRRGRHRRSLGDRVLGRRPPARTSRSTSCTGGNTSSICFTVTRCAIPPSRPAASRSRLRQTTRCCPIFTTRCLKPYWAAPSRPSSRWSRPEQRGRSNSRSRRCRPRATRLPMYAATALTTRPRGTAC